MPLTSAERVRQYRSLRKDLGVADTTRRNRRAEKARWKAGASLRRPFCGCDGEGAGRDEQGRQNYLLFRAGDRELYTGSHLKTAEILGFICDHPAKDVMVGFAFGYDVTMILRDLSEAQRERLFQPLVFSEGHSPYVWYKEFDIQYLPRNYLKVRRVKIERTEDGKERRIPIKGSQRTIYETFGFFQKSFLKCLYEFDIGTSEQRETIARSKDRRGAEDWNISQEERDYCALECEFLAELMEKLRANCYAAGIRPHTWSGAGKLAAALHKKHDTPSGAVAMEHVPPEVIDLAQMAYYGGRFEITRTGFIDQEVYEYDITSAYPAAMPGLPCLLHGRWKPVGNSYKCRDDELSLCGVSFSFGSSNSASADFGKLYGFPVRSKEGHLFWPRQGNGIYWSCEIRSSERLGARCKISHGWRYVKSCDCKLFDWVEELFEYRKSIGKQGPGYPIKLGINSLYGKLAQRKGNGSYANMIWAGLITAQTRSKINDAIAVAGPGAIVMCATDAVYSLRPLDAGLRIGERLGEWEMSPLDGLFIVQPGLYWCPEKRKRKSRGLSGKFFENNERTEAFEAAWLDWLAGVNSNLDQPFPSVSVDMQNFIGLKLARARGKPELAGVWLDEHRDISFDYRNKRVGHAIAGRGIVTKPKLGSASLWSLPHRDFLAAGGHEPFEQARMIMEEQPDYIDLGPPFQD